MNVALIIMPLQANAEKQLAELEAKLASHGIEAASLKAAADAELKQAHVAADAKIQTYNQRTNEVFLHIPAAFDVDVLGLRHFYLQSSQYCHVLYRTLRLSTSLYFLIGTES